MTKRQITNVAASVRQQLLNLARSTDRPFQEVLQYYAMERFLYRLAQSPYVDRFILKGALMFHAWGISSSRPTKDIDLLGRIENSIETLVATIRDTCLQDVEEDGLAFDAASVTGVLIKEDADYEGVRVLFRGTLENAQIAMQIDIGFGDVVYPDCEMTEYPVILDQAAPKLRGYSRESAIAEKFEAMVKLGLLNSRMKDFYDLWLFSRQFDFEGATLASAIEKTFSNRGTPVVAQPTALSTAFALAPAKATQWQGFLRKSHLSDAPSDLQLVVETIATFLAPPAAAIAEARSFTQEWIAPGPWVSV